MMLQRSSTGCVGRGTTGRAGPLAGHSARLLSARPFPVVRSAAQPEASSEAAEEIRVTLRKPIGLVFEQKPEGGPVFVSEVTEGGAAAKSGKVRTGDVLSKCSAVVLKAGKEGKYANEGYGERPYDNWEVIEFDCEGKEFKTVTSALRSNNERWGVRDISLVLRRP